MPVNRTVIQWLNNRNILRDSLRIINQPRSYTTPALASTPSSGHLPKQDLIKELIKYDVEPNATLLKHLLIGSTQLQLKGLSENLLNQCNDFSKLLSLLERMWQVSPGLSKRKGKLLGESLLQTLNGLNVSQFKTVEDQMQYIMLQIKIYSVLGLKIPNPNLTKLQTSVQQLISFKDSVAPVLYAQAVQALAPFTSDSLIVEKIQEIQSLLSKGVLGIEIEWTESELLDILRATLVATQHCVSISSELKPLLDRLEPAVEKIGTSKESQQLLHTLHLLYLEEVVNTKDKLPNTMLKSIQSRLKTKIPEHRQLSCQLTFSLSVRLHKANSSLLSFETLDKLYLNLRMEHNFQPRLQDYNDYLSVVCRDRKGSTQGENQKLVRTKAIYSSLKRSGLIPTHETFIHLFKACAPTSFTNSKVGCVSDEIYFFEAEMQDWGLQHSAETIAAMTSCFVKGKLFNECTARYDELRFHSVPTNPGFYASLIQSFSQSEQGSLYVLSEFMYKMKRDPQYTLTMEIVENLLNCCIRVGDTEQLFRISQEALTKNLTTVNGLKRMLYDKISMENLRILGALAQTSNLPRISIHPEKYRLIP